MVIDLSAKREEKKRTQAQNELADSDLVRIPILEKFYQIDGINFYEVKGDNTPRKWSEYSTYFDELQKR